MRGLPFAVLLAGCFSNGLPDLSSGNDAAAYPLFADDFETEGAFPDAGGWSVYGQRTGSALRRGADGAHRGASGLVYEATATGTGNSVCSHLGAHLAPDAGLREASVRAWSRMRQTNRGGYAITMFLESDNLTDPTQGGLTGAPHLIHNAEHADGTQFIRNTMPIDAGTWLLMELSVRECDASGRCLALLHVDGRERSRWVIERGTSRITGFGVGSVFCGREFTGVIDFDDVRLARGPQASTLALSSDGGAVGACSPLRVELRDSFGTPADAPYDLDVDVSIDGGEAFGDDRCTTPGRVRLLKGGRATGAWWRPARAGASWAGASHDDFVSAPATLVAQ